MVIDGWVNWQSLWQIPGTAGLPDLTPQQWATAIDAIVSHVKADLGNESACGANVPADQVYAHLAHLDDLIGASIDNIMSQSVGDSSTGLFYRALQAWIGLQMLNPHSIYNCYAGYSRLHHDI